MMSVLAAALTLPAPAAARAESGGKPTAEAFFYHFRAARKLSALVAKS